MAPRRNTKKMFADELELMMPRFRLSQIRVADLCARCGVERRVFYYHFKDKYDLVAWMYEQDYLAATEVGAPYTEELYAEAHRRIWDRREFYKRAFEEDAQNSIYRYLIAWSVSANETALKRYQGVAKLSQEAKFIARHFAYGNVGCVVEWLQGGIEATPKQLAKNMFTSMPKCLRDAYASEYASLS